ncbi:hypothetical protein E2C01_067290 [Portunus trituberculatus]|uniref:Uncharacterized protein n=1 Tax=Portunus trituberculatus TaxID=210409 RepID=A0A5B7HX22_PORTR|nr:hypothetical protein [Portunus trituberculatus]
MGFNISTVSYSHPGERNDNIVYSKGGSAWMFRRAVTDSRGVSYF